jgi:hypothetical protein
MYFIFSVPQAEWDPELVYHHDIAPKVRLEVTNEDDVEENEEEGTYLDLFIFYY